MSTPVSCAVRQQRPQVREGRRQSSRCRHEPVPAPARGNPVDWWQWGDEAFAEAARRDVPVLLSIGYAACHWCHVMAHESFEDPEIAAQMNAGFVCVKVDREERPDVDAVYMEATQALTGHGGWPMTVFLTPQGRPVFAGTYFPPAARTGLPGFGQVLSGHHRGLDRRRDEVDDAGERITAELAKRARAGGLGATRRAAALSAAVLHARTAGSTRSEADSAARPSSRRPWSWSGCCGTPPATRPNPRPASPWRWPTGRPRRWPAVGCTTSSTAASPATASTPAGSCRTSRRCSTTTRCWPGSTCTCGG